MTRHDATEGHRRRGADGRRGRRRLEHVQSVFIGVGRPSTAAILARMVHNPELVLVYESGTIGAKPFHIPLSIGDGELARDRRLHRLGPRDVQLLDRGGADRRRVPRRRAGRPLREPQLDRDRRLRPSEDAAAGRRRRAGDRGQLRRGDRDRAAHARARSSSGSTSSRRSDTATVPGPASGSGFRGAGPTAVITDLGVLEPDPETQGARADPDPRGRRARPGPRGDRLGARGRRRAAHHRAADRRGARRRCGSW